MLPDSHNSALADDFQDLFQFYRQQCPYRNDALFLKFLPTGYRATTLSCVPSSRFEHAVMAKLHLGMLITLYDDFADNPELQNAALLEELYKVPYDNASIMRGALSPEERGIVNLGIHLGAQLLTIIQTFPNYEIFADFFRFDLWQFYQCNRFSQLVTSMPSAANCLELSIYGPHNMGMIAAGMIDLMAAATVHVNELGAMRTVLGHGQRIGRICNMLTTHKREMREGDMTNELHIMPLEGGLRGDASSASLASVSSASTSDSQLVLQQEREALFSQIEALAHAVTTFDVLHYVNGLHALQQLHEDMTHEI